MQSYRYAVVCARLCSIQMCGCYKKRAENQTTHHDKAKKKHPRKILSKIWTKKQHNITRICDGIGQDGMEWMLQHEYTQRCYSFSRFFTLLSSYNSVLSVRSSFVVDFHAFYVRLAKVEHFIYSQRYILRGCTLYGYARIHLHTVAWHAQIDGRYHLCTHAWIYTKRPMTPKAFGGTSMDTYKFVNRQKPYMDLFVWDGKRVLGWMIPFSVF